MSLEVKYLLNYPTPFPICTLTNTQYVCPNGYQASSEHISSLYGDMFYSIILFPMPKVLYAHLPTYLTHA